MRSNSENPRNIVDRFLSDLGEQIPSEQAERATENVRERLHLEDWRTHAPIALWTPSHSKPTRIWGAVAAAAVVILVGALLQMALLPRAESDVVATSVQGDLTFAEGVRGMFATSPGIGAGRVLRAGAGGGAITLVDGSKVEIGPQAELSVVRVSEGLSVRLASGTVIITAAKQREGHHLYVETKDCLISVVGTVFAVNAEESGSQISVIEGEVHVQRGEISQTLLAGQQASTSPVLGPLAQNPVSGWLAAERLALLQQTTVPAPRPPADVVPVAAVAAEQNPSGSIVRGIVKNATSGEGIPGVTVTLCPVSGTRLAWARPYFNATGEVPAGGQPETGRIVRNKAFFFALWDDATCNGETMKTDPAGRFEFSNVKPGDYMVTAEKDGYITAPNATASDKDAVALQYWINGAAGYTVGRGRELGRFLTYGNALAPSKRTSVAVDARQPVSDISLTLLGGMVLAGRVRDADGKPVPNAVVRIVSRMAGTTSDGPTVTTMLTNELGEYKAYGLMPGEYRVAASLPNGLPSSETWFSRTANPSEITVIPLKDGEEITNIDIVLQRR